MHVVLTFARSSLPPRRPPSDVASTITMPKKSKPKATPLEKTAKPKATADTCVICMNVPPAGQGEHHCNSCTPGAWVVCAGCEEAIKGKKCPICRGDYMRESASGWDALPANTTTLELDEQPGPAFELRCGSEHPPLAADGACTVQVRVIPEVSSEKSSDLRLGTLLKKEM